MMATTTGQANLEVELNNDITKKHTYGNTSNGIPFLYGKQTVYNSFGRLSIFPGSIP